MKLARVLGAMLPLVSLGVFALIDWLLWVEYSTGRLALPDLTGLSIAGIGAFVMMMALKQYPPRAERFRVLLPLWRPVFLVMWALLVGAFLLVWGRVAGLSGARAWLAFVVLALVPIAPLKPSNFRCSGYQVFLVFPRTIAFWSWVLGVLLALRGPWTLPEGFLKGLLLFWLAPYVVASVYFLEYRVDWAALQREVEARTGASSSGA